ncbi:secondary thiamine-phosphate synthase enzyme YjbQ [Blastochloris tepida]|uniref:Secondary thiamine-phosphate synthase enzyme n=1 Tax=Blastochloris tepida TaxID=2233851 RepID=A0A348G5Q1_9HYPH|nr:hypothetical protein BLTE_35690 [Blastochloris tepida]
MRMPVRRGPLAAGDVARWASATLEVATRGRGLVEITAELAAFVADAGLGDGLLTVFCRHTSASLTIQENADPDVRTDLLTALDRLAPENAGWIHRSEGPDDMPAHIKAMLTGTSLGIPIVGGRLALGTWQGVYVVEHRARAHRREVVLQAMGA